MSWKSIFYPLIAMAIWAGSQTLFGNGEDSRGALRYATDDLYRKCDSLRESYSDKNVRGYWAFTDSVHVEVKKSIVVNKKSVTVLIISCGPFGELSIIDTAANIEHALFAKFNIPGSHVALGNCIDVNGDGYDELPLYLNAGAHGYYTYFLSVFDDSLSFVTDTAGNAGFFAIRGGIHAEDIDNDGIYEIIVDGVPPENKSVSYEIFKWNGKHYSVTDKIVK